jgi:hypothetical protein
LIAGGAGDTAGQDAACIDQLREVPLETLKLPDGYTWGYLEWTDVFGTWNSVVEPRGRGYLNLRIHCSSDAAATMTRDQELRDFDGSYETLEVVAIGDESAAYRFDDGAVGITWRTGDFLGSIIGQRSNNERDLAVQEQLAQDADALLRQGAAG